MIELAITSALTTTWILLVLLVYRLQPVNQSLQRHRHGRVRRARILIHPDRRRRRGSMSEAAESREQGRGEEIERADEEGEGDEAVGAYKSTERAQRLPLRLRLPVQKPITRFTKSRLIFETGADANANPEQTLDSKPTRSSIRDSVDAGHTHPCLPHPASVPSLRLTAPDSNVHSILLPEHGAEQDASCEVRNDDTLHRQRRRRVRFDEALRMHSYGGSQYGGRVVDRNAKGMMVEREKVEEEDA